MPRGTQSSSRRGFTIIELLIVIFILALLISILLPSLNRARETANRVKCASNLRQIGLACIMYQNENRGGYPRTNYTAADKVIPDISNAGYDSPDPFAKDTKVPDNCIPSAIWLLLRNEDISSAVFVCPTSQCEPDNYGGAPGASAITRSNWTDVNKNLSYGYANPYPDNAALGAGYKLVAGMDPGFAIVADRSPGGEGLLAVSANSTFDEKRQGNSKNHGQDGQNVLYADGHVEFQNTCLCGLNSDNIYIRGAGPSQDKDDLLNSPKDPTDSVILPAEGN